MRKCNVVLPIATNAKFSAGDVVNLIRSLGMADYSCDANNSGCLYWVTTVLRCMVAQGWLAGNTIPHLAQQIGQFRQAYGDEFWFPNDKGVFGAVGQENGLNAFVAL